MRIARTRMLGLSAAISALAIGGAAIPAHAADPTLTLSGPAAIAVDPEPLNADHGAPGAYITVDLTLSNPSAQVGWAVVQIDTGSLKGVADVQTPYGCTASGTTLTCPQVFLNQGHGQLNLNLNAPKGGTAGSTGTLHTSAHLSSGNTTPVTYDTKVTLGGPRLQWNDVPVNRSLKPGDTWTPALTLTNAGQLPAPQLFFTFVGGMGLDFKSRFSNCEYGTSDHGDAVICTVNSTVTPGETVHLDPIQFGVSSSAYYAYEDINVATIAPSPDDWILKGFHYTPGPTGSPRLTVGKPETTPAPTGVISLAAHAGYGGLTAVVPNTTDFAAFGAWAPQPGGKQGKLTVGMTSSGPASIFWRAGDDPADVAVTLPKQVKVVSAPDKCRLDSQFKSDSEVRYVCQTNPLIPAGFKVSFDFTVQVDPAANASAVVTLPSIGEDQKESGKPWDPNKANDTVTVALGSQPSSGIPTGPATPPPTAVPGPPTATATPAAPGHGGSSTASATPTASSSGSTRSGLAFTGADGIGTMVGLGLGAIALGGGVIAFTARRRKAGAHE